MLGKKLGTAAVDAAMKDMDADGNGEVSLPEFKAWWDENGGRCSPFPPPPPPAAEKKKKKKKKPSHQSVTVWQSVPPKTGKKKRDANHVKQTYIVCQEL